LKYMKAPFLAPRYRKGAFMYFVAKVAFATNVPPRGGPGHPYGLKFRS